MNVKKLIKKIYHYLIYLVAAGFAWFGRTLSYHRSQKLGATLGKLAFILLKKERLKTLSNIQQAYGNELNDMKTHELGKKCFEHLGICMFEVFQLPNIIRNNINSYVVSEGMENLEYLKKQNSGAILITGHLGNWELLGAYLANNGINLTVIARKNSNPYLDKLLNHHRRIAGFHTIYREGARTVKQSLRLLRNGEFLGMLVDQHIKVESVKTPFFGKSAHTPIGPFTLARKLSIPVIFTTIHRESDGKHHAIFSPPLDLKESDNKSSDLIENATLINTLYEQTIRKHPEQWVWMHNRWRNN